MVEIDEFLARERMLLGLRSGSKRQLFQDLAADGRSGDRAGSGGDPAALSQREKLGTTGIGEGIAIPHARCQAADQLTGFFARLATPVDYDALDDAPVDLVFLLLAPEEATRCSSRRWPASPGSCAIPRSARRLRREPEPPARLRRCCRRGRRAAAA